MADDDPYAKYLPGGGVAAPSAAPVAVPNNANPTPVVTPEADPYSKYVTPSTNTPASTTATGPKPGEPGNETLPWFNTTQYSQQPTKIGAWLNSAIDAGTGGLADTAQGYINKLGIGDTNKTPEQIRQDTENLRGDIGPLGSISADIAGYAVGPGKLGAGAKIAKLIAPKAAAVVGERAAPIAARIIGSGVESGGASMAGTVGHGDLNPGDILHSGEVGLGLGMLTGVIPGGRGSQAPKTGSKFDLGLGEYSPTTGLEAGEKAAFSPLKNTHYDAGDVAIHFDPVTSNMPSGDRVALRGTKLKDAADGVSQELMDKFTKGQPVTVSDIAKFKRTLMEKATNIDETRIAGDYGRALDTALSTRTPTQWGSFRPGTNMSEVVNQANKASSKAKSSADIDDWIERAQSGDTSVPKEVGKQLKETNFFNAEPPTRPLLQQASAYKPSWLGTAARFGADKAIGAAAGEGLNYMTGGTLPAWAAVGLGAGVGHGASTLIPKGAPNALIEKLAQARHANATGNAGFRPDFNPGVKGFGPLITYGQRGLPGIGASGAFDPNNPR